MSEIIPAIINTYIYLYYHHCSYHQLSWLWMLSMSHFVIMIKILWSPLLLQWSSTPLSILHRFTPTSHHTNTVLILLKTRHIVAKFFPTSPGAERDLRQPRVRLTPVRRESRVLLQDGQMRPDLDWPGDRSDKESKTLINAVAWPQLNKISNDRFWFLILLYYTLTVMSLGV